MPARLASLNKAAWTFTLDWSRPALAAYISVASFTAWHVFHFIVHDLRSWSRGHVQYYSHINYIQSNKILDPYYTFCLSWSSLFRPTEFLMLQAYYILYHRYSGAVHACWTAGPATQGESEMSQCKSRRKFARLISSSHLIVWSGELDRRCPWEVDLQRLIFSFIQQLDHVYILLLTYVHTTSKKRRLVLLCHGPLAARFQHPARYIARCTCLIGVEN